MPDPDGSEEDIVPTQEAVALLESNIEAMLEKDISISSVMINVESDDLLGTIEE